MEPLFNFSNDNSITELLDESYIDFFASIPLATTYLELVILLVTIPATITAVIIHIIRKTEELHTNYCLFLVNLLIGDLSIVIRYCFGIVIIIFYLLNIRVYISDIVYIIPRIVIQYSFVLLAIDRVVGVTFPYQYRSPEWYMLLLHRYG